MIARTCTCCGTFLHASYFATARTRTCNTCVGDRMKLAIQRQQSAIARERKRVGHVQRPADPLNVVASEWLRAA